MSDKSDEGEPKLPAHWNKVKSSVAEPGRDYYFNVKNRRSVWTLREALLPKNNVCKRKPFSRTIPKPPSDTPEESSENDDMPQSQKVQKFNDQTTRNKHAPPSYDLSRSSQNFPQIPPMWPPSAFPYNPIPPNYPFPQAWNFPQNVHYPAFANTQENLITFGNPQSSWQSVNKSESSIHQKPPAQPMFSQIVNPTSHFEMAPTNQNAEQLDAFNEVQIEANHNAGESVRLVQIQKDSGQSDGGPCGFYENSEDGNKKAANIRIRRSLSTSNLVSAITDEKSIKWNLKEDDLRLKLMKKRERHHSMSMDVDTEKWKGTTMKQSLSASALNTEDVISDNTLDTSKSETNSSSEMDEDLSPLTGDSYGYWLLKKAKPQTQPIVYICIDTNIFICELELVKELVRLDKERICRLLVPFVVHYELDCLKKSTCADRRETNTRRRATLAMRFISEEIKKPNHSVVTDSIVKKPDMMIKRYVNDDEIINCCIQYQGQNIHVVLLTGDVGLSNKTELLGIPCYTAHKMKKLLRKVQEQIETRDLFFKLQVTIPNKTAKKSNTDDTGLNTQPIKLVCQIQNQKPLVQHSAQPTTKPYLNAPPVIVRATPPVVLPAAFDPTIPPPPFHYLSPYIPNHTFIRPVTSVQSCLRSERGLDTLSTALKTIGNSEKVTNVGSRSISSANSSDSFGRAKKFPDLQGSPKTKGMEEKAPATIQPEAKKVTQHSQISKKNANTEPGHQPHKYKLIRKAVLEPTTQEKPGDKVFRSKWVRTAPCDTPVPKERAPTEKPTIAQQPAISSFSSTTNYPSVTTASVVSKSLTVTIDSFENPESTNEIVSVKDPRVQQKSTSEDVNSLLQIPLTRDLIRKLTTRMDEWTVWFEQIMDDVVTNVLMPKTCLHISPLHVQQVATCDIVVVSDTQEEGTERVRVVDISPVQSESRPHAPRLLQPPWSLHEAVSALAECYQHENWQLSAAASRLARKVDDALKIVTMSDKISESERTAKVCYRRLSPKNPEVFISLYKEARALVSLLKAVHDKAEVEKAENNLIILLNELQQGKLEAKHDQLSVQASVDNMAEGCQESEDITEFRPKQGIDVHGMIIDYLKKHYEEWSQFREPEIDTVQVQADKPEKNIELGVKFTLLPEFEAKLKNCNLEQEDELLEDEEEWEEDDGMDIDEYAEEENIYEEEVEADGTEIRLKIFKNDQVETTNINKEVEDIVIDQNAQREYMDINKNAQVEDIVVDDKTKMEDTDVNRKVQVDDKVVDENARMEDAAVVKNVHVKNKKRGKGLIEKDNNQSISHAITQCILNVKVYSYRLVDKEVPKIYRKGDSTHLPPVSSLLNILKPFISCLESIDQEMQCDGKKLITCIRLLAPSSVKNLPTDTEHVVAGVVLMRKRVPRAYADCLFSINRHHDDLQTYHQCKKRHRAKRLAKGIK